MPSPSLWTHARAALDPYARRWTGQYLAYPLTREEYVATVDYPLAVLKRHLRNCGYGAQRLSAAKRHPETKELHVLSMRKVPDLHPFDAVGTELAEYSPRSCQFHVHAFPSVTGTGLDVYSHYEYRPFTAPLRHYRPTYDRDDTPRTEWTYLRGVTDVDW